VLVLDWYSYPGFSKIPIRTGCKAEVASDALFLIGKGAMAMREALRDTAGTAARP
jgi:hypothetical protein